MSRSNLRRLGFLLIGAGVLLALIEFTRINLAPAPGPVSEAYVVETN